MATRAKASSPPADTLGGHRARLEQLAGRREALLEERAMVEAAPSPPAVSLAVVDRVVERLAAPIREWGYGAEIAQRPDEWPATARHLGNIGRGAPGSPLSPAGLIAAAVPELLREWLRGEVESAYRALPAPIDAEVRSAKLSELDREIAEVERASADLWWQSIDQGMSLSPPPFITGAAALGLEP